MKATFTFGFTDSNIRTPESRERVAKALRAYRADPKRFELRRLPDGYSVAVRGFSGRGLFAKLK